MKMILCCILLSSSSAFSQYSSANQDPEENAKAPTHGQSGYVNIDKSETDDKTIEEQEEKELDEKDEGETRMRSKKQRDRD